MKKKFRLAIATITVLSIVFLNSCALMLLELGSEGYDYEDDHRPTVAVNAPANTPDNTPANTQANTSGNTTGNTPTNAPDSYNTSGGRPYYTEILGGSNDVVTLMLYLCGSDLESYSGAASEDLGEILDAYTDNPNLNIIVETGGADYWYNSDIPSNTNARFKIEDGELIYLEDAGLKDMTAPETVTEFIEFGKNNYPADRYMFIMWDHGGGTTGGLMYDEIFYNSPSLAITDLDDALRNAGVKFDMVGFDCCLMGTAETAFMVEKHADFMVASQRNEPGTGWYYTDFIEALNNNTSIPTTELGTLIVENYFDYTPYQDELEGDLTLSLLDLSYIDSMFYEMDVFFDMADEALLTDINFINIARTLAGYKSINDDSQADLMTLIEEMGGSEALFNAIDQVIVYSDAILNGYNGLSMFFPYRDLSLVSDALYIYDEIGISDTYQSFIKTAANIMAGGQSYSSGGSSNPYGDDWSEDYYDYDWYDDSYMDDYSDFYDDTCFDYDELELEMVDGQYVLQLSDEDYELITEYLLCVYYDDGEGYVELGQDAWYVFDDYGNLIVDYDYTWVALDGMVVPFYSIENVTDAYGEFLYNYGSVPCEIDGEDAEIILLWNDEYPYGTVAGWRYDTYGEASMKGLFELEDGLAIDFYYYYYPYYSDEIEAYYMWDTVIVDGEMSVSYEDMTDLTYGDIEVYYELIDIYQNTYYTESLFFEGY
ncbi:MAG: hypothetical protein LBM60_05950 [Clostridium sp.]|jgi:hypothetical protein|nr:hypothetical protein [Clostridium sp.]